MFCKNCGNKLDDNDRVCAVCGETVDTIRPGNTGEVREKTMEKPVTEAKLTVDEDIKTPLFNFKWNVQDFPNEDESKTEDIDFKWEASDKSLRRESSAGDSSVVEQMKGAVDAEEIAKTPSFSDEVEKVEPATDEWYEPFAIKKDTDEDTMFKFNKKNEEFQELLDREFEKYNKTRQTPPVDVNTKRYKADDFVPEPEEPVHIITPEELVDAKQPEEPAGAQIFDTTSASPFVSDSTPTQTPTQAFASPFDDSDSIDNDEFLSELPAGSGDIDKEESKTDEEKKAVGPEIVNEPVVFPFEMDNTAELEPIKPEQIQEAAKETPDVANTDTSNAKVNVQMPQAKFEVKEGNGLIKGLVAVIIIILVLLAGIGVMKFLPQSMLGMALNNLSDVVFNTGGQEESDSKVVEPNTDIDALIKSQLSNVNRNIKAIPYDDSVGYDEKINYTLSGANESVPIENNFWKSGSDGELLFDEQAVKTVIGYNSTWIGYVNDDYNDVFNYVVSGSNAEKSLKDENVDKIKSAEFNKLGIGEIRQNGTKFYVWTKETITINKKDGKEEKATIKQLYELELGTDSLKISNIEKL